MKITNQIKSNLQKSDIAIRYSGDEFLVFSNKINAIPNSELYCVGYSQITNKNIDEAISMADKIMLSNKKYDINR